MPHLEILALKLVTHEQQRANNRMAIYLGLPVVVHVTVVLHVGDLRDHGTEDGPTAAVLLDRAVQALGEELVEVVVGVVAVLALQLLLLRCSGSRRSTVQRLALSTASGCLELLLHPPLLLLGLLFLEPPLTRSLRLSGALLLGLGFAPRPLVLGSLIRGTTIALVIDPGPRLAVPCGLAGAPLRRGSAWLRVHRHADLLLGSKMPARCLRVRSRACVPPSLSGDDPVSGEWPANVFRGFHFG